MRQYLGDFPIQNLLWDYFLNVFLRVLSVYSSSFLYRVRPDRILTCLM